MTHIGIIYGYPHYVGQVQSGDPRCWKRRWRTHARRHPDWPAPVVLETVTGNDRAGLLFNLAFQETVWMFTKHTYRLSWPDGMNKAIPFKSDYSEIGRIGGRIGARNQPREAKARAGRIGSRRAHATMAKDPEKYRELFSRKAAFAAHATMAKNPEKYRELRSCAGRIGIRAAIITMNKNPEKYRAIRSQNAHAANATMAKNPEKYRAIRSRVGLASTHWRWHIARGLKNTSCSLCVAEVTS